MSSAPQGPYFLVPAVNQNAVLGCASGNSSEGTPIVLASIDGTLNQHWQVHFQYWPVGSDTGSIGFCPYHNLNMAFDCNNGVNNGNTCWLWGYDDENANQNFFYNPVPGTDYTWGFLQRASDGAFVTATGPDYNDTLTMVSSNDGYPTNQWWQLNWAVGTVTAEEKRAFFKKCAAPETVKQRWARMREERERAQRPKIADKPFSAGHAVASIETFAEAEKADHAVEAVPTSSRRCFHCIAALLLALLSAGLFLLGLMFGARWGK